jgi:hypothetical protein
MIPKDDLFELIKSLSPNEKRYFKINSFSHDTNHMRLFEEIDSQTIYDEASIKEKFKNDNFVKQLTFTKNYLYNEIINSLVEYRRSSSSETELLTLVLRLRALFKKGLFKQYFKQLEFAKKKAWQYEKFYILLEILRMSRLIMDTKKFRIQSPEKLYKEEEYIIKRIRNLSSYSKLFNKAVRLKRQIGISPRDINNRKVNDLLDEPLLKDFNKALSTQAQEYFYHIKQVLYSIRGDVQNQREASIKRLEIIENNPKPFMDDIINVQKEALYTLIEISISLNDKASFEKYMTKYFMLSKSRLSRIDYFVLELYMRLVYMISSQDFTDGEKIVSGVENYLIKYKDKLNRDTELESIFLIIKYYFLLGKYDKALNYINRLLSHPVLKYRRDIYIYTRIINIPVHYELGNFTLVEYLIGSLKKTLKNEKDIYDSEILALDILSRILERSKTTLIKLPRNTGTSSNSLYYFDILDWTAMKFNLPKTSINTAV